MGVAPGHALLHFDGATHGLNRADKSDQHAVAGGLNDAAVVRGDAGFDQLLSAGPYLGERPFLVSSNQARVARDIGRKNRYELPFDLMPGCSVRWHGLSLRKVADRIMGRGIFRRALARPSGETNRGRSAFSMITCHVYPSSSPLSASAG